MRDVVDEAARRGNERGNGWGMRVWEEQEDARSRGRTRSKWYERW